jgi:hypothetical protein
MENVECMKANNFIKNKEADVLGLPMYLIIVMIVAVAVIAAVVAMIPRGTRTLQASVTTGALGAKTQHNGTATVNISSLKVKVYSNDERRDPIKGATVTISGLGVAISLSENSTTTGTYDEIQGDLRTAKLPANVNEGYLKLIVKAPGYETFEDPHAILVIRP